jgi:hypothetical protein
MVSVMNHRRCEPDRREAKVDRSMPLHLITDVFLGIFITIPTRTCTVPTAYLTSIWRWVNEQANKQRY